MNGANAESAPSRAANPAGRLVATAGFRGAVLAAILVGAVLVGLETIPEIETSHGRTLWAIDRVVLAIFVLEALLKIAAEGRRPWRYFMDPWNVFDFTVTAVCLLPLHAEYAQVLRLGRVARSLRMVTALPRLQLIVGALLRSLPSFGWITLLLFTLLYSFSVMGVFLFGANDPARFGSLWTSMLTMFGVLTLEGWVDIMRDQMEGLPRDDGTVPPGSPIAAPVFFVSFILSGTMIFLNLLVGVIVNSMSELPEGERAAEGRRPEESPLPSLHAPGAESPHTTLLVERLARIEARMEAILEATRTGRG